MPEYAALDLETTGLDPARDRVIEVGAVAFTPERISGTMERLVDPGRQVPETVLRLTGIRQDELRGAASPESALRELSFADNAGLVSNVVKLGAPLPGRPLAAMDRVQIFDGGTVGKISQRYPERSSGGDLRSDQGEFASDHLSVAFRL